MENIGEKIMQARKTKGMTQDTLAQLVNVSRQTVSHWENGRAMPDVATAAQLSKVLDVDFMADEVVGIVLPMLPKAQAQIELSYPPENAYMMKEDGGFVGWMIHFYSTNVSDVPFTPTYAQAKWYEGDKLNGSSPAVDYNYMRNWMESDALVKGETPLDLYYGTDRQNVDRGVFIISGTDANGHELKFSISIDLIHEFPPESEN